VNKILLLSFLWVFTSPSMATSMDEPLKVQDSFNWVFSGMINNEQAERYGYYFEIQKKGDQFRILSALINLERKSLVFVEESQAKLKDIALLNWQVGHSYFGFNTVTHNLAFGVKTPTGQGFSFKVDALNDPVSTTKPQSLSAELALNVIQMGRLNGHLYLGPEHADEFVTAKQTWFRQLFGKTNKPHEKNHDVTGVLCQFDDGSGFYAMHLPESDALRGFVAGWRDPAGKPVKMSQFVKITENLPHEWDLSVSLPALHVRFSDVLAKNGIAAGVVKGKKSGFCTAEKERV
jgi:hypothetical protein